VRCQDSIVPRFFKRLFGQNPRSGTKLLNGKTPHQTRADRPLVSVIIPVFNSAPWLAECVNSVLSQPKVSLEVILVNDGSTDESQIILDQYQAAYPNLRIFSQPNSGLSVTRNNGMRAATGKYLIFIDSDDYWAPKKLRKLVTQMERQNLDLLFFGMHPFLDGSDADESYETFKRYYPRTVRSYQMQSGISLFAKLLEHDDYRPSACGYLVRRSIIEKYHLSFIPGLTHEDETFTYQVLVNCHRAAAIDEVFYYRRVHAGSIMTSSSILKSAVGKGIAAVTVEHGITDTPAEYQLAIQSRIDALWRRSRYLMAQLPPPEQASIEDTFNRYRRYLEEADSATGFRV